MCNGRLEDWSVFSGKAPGISRLFVVEGMLSEEEGCWRGTGVFRCVVIVWLIGVGR